MEETTNRRPIDSRNAGWAKKIAAWLAERNVSPNTISLLSIMFALFSLAVFWADYQISGIFVDERFHFRHIGYMLLAIAFIQLRLLMNMLDGMVAVEYNRKSILGGLFNEVPDRISDTLTLLGVGIVAKDYDWCMTLAWCAIFLSVMTAYIRTLGASMGCGHFFSGPMAKPHRMAFVCAGCIIAIFWMPVFYYLLIVMNIGLVITCYRRLFKIVSSLKSMNP